MRTIGLLCYERKCHTRTQATTGLPKSLLIKSLSTIVGWLTSKPHCSSEASTEELERLAHEDSGMDAKPS